MDKENIQKTFWRVCSPSRCGRTMGKFDDNGNLLWHIFDQFSNSTNALSVPDLGPDGIIYNGRNLNTLYAINPDSSIRWQYTDPVPLMIPIVSPVNDLIFVGGATNGQPGFFETVSTKVPCCGRFLCPLKMPGHRSRSFCPGTLCAGWKTAYIGTSIAGQTSNGYSYLYSVQTESTAVSLASLALNPITVKGSTSSRGTVTLSAPASAGGAVVTLASNKNAARVPANVTICRNRTRPLELRAYKENAVVAAVSPS